jgi:GNAT superfamily N-acetyltransferase
MADILTDLAPASLAAAVKANLLAFFQSFRASSLAAAHDHPPGFRWQTAVAHPWFNGVLSLQPPAEDVDDTVQDTLAYFQSHAVASFSWWLAPHLEPAPWSQHLLPRGFHYSDRTPGMALDLAALPAPARQPLTIRRVEDSQTLAEWLRAFIQGYGIPEAMQPAFLALLESLGLQSPFRHYLGSLDDRPVAASTLFVGAGVASIYNVATLADVRGQGIGSAMTLAALYDARDLGYRAGVLQSSEMGYPVYERLGIQKICQVDHFYWAGQPSQVGGE